VFYLAACYKRLCKFAEASALYNRAKELAAEALKLQQALPEKIEGEMEQLQEVLKEAPVQILTVQACAVLGLDEFTWLAQQQQQQRPHPSEEKKKQLPKELLDRLDSFDGGSAEQHHTLVHFPPLLQPTPCKPVLFDLAFNHLDFPDLSHRIAESKAKEAPKVQPQHQQQQKAKAPAPAPAQPAQPAPAKQAAPKAAEPAPKQEQPQEKRGFFSRLWGR